MAADANLRGKAKIEGAKQAADDLKKIASAQDKVESTQKKVTDAQDKGAEATSKAAASTEELSSSLNRVSPALGGFIDGLRGAFTIAGDLANRQINLTDLFKKGRTAIRNNAKALKLLLAGGAVAAGIALIAKSVSLMREEFAKARAEIKRTQEALTEIKGQEADTRAAIEAVSDKRGKIGPATSEQSRQGLEDFKNISKQFSQIDKSALTNVVGNTAGLGFSRDQIADLAILEQSGKFQILPDASADRTKRASLAAIEENQGLISGFRKRESQQGQGLGDPRAFRGRTELEAAAANEAVSKGGSQTALNKLIGQKFPDLPQEDAQKLAELAQEQGTIGGLRSNLAASKKLPGTETTILRNDEPGFFPGTASATRVSGSDLSRLESLLEDLAKSNRDLAESIKNQPPSVVQHDGRYMGIDANADAARRENSETVAAGVEVP